MAAKDVAPISPSDHVIVIAGDMFPYLQKAVADNRWAEVDLRGFTSAKDRFRQISPDGGLLIGFEIGFANNKDTGLVVACGRSS